MMRIFFFFLNESFVEDDLIGQLKPDPKDQILDGKIMNSSDFRETLGGTCPLSLNGHDTSA